MFVDSITLGDANVIGFGSTRVKYKSDYPCILQEANIKIFSRQQCKGTDLQPAFTNIPGTFCAGKLAGGVDSCDVRCSVVKPYILDYKVLKVEVQQADLNLL